MVMVAGPCMSLMMVVAPRICAFVRMSLSIAAMMAMHVMEARNLPSRLKLDRLKLARLLLTAERGYTPANPYHNAVHAANVVRTLYCILNAGSEADPALADLITARYNAMMTRKRMAML